VQAAPVLKRCSPARLRDCRPARPTQLFLRARAGLAAAGAQQGASSALAAGQPAAWNLTAPGPASVLTMTPPAAAAPVRMCPDCSSASQHGTTCGHTLLRGYSCRRWRPLFCLSTTLPDTLCQPSLSRSRLRRLRASPQASLRSPKLRRPRPSPGRPRPSLGRVRRCALRPRARLSTTPAAPRGRYAAMRALCPSG
jgi:hypothetical protein